MVSEIFGPDHQELVPGSDEFGSITYHHAVDVPVVQIAFDRPGVRNASRLGTVDELYAALDDVRKYVSVGCALFTGNGPSEKDNSWAFYPGDDQSVRGGSGYEYCDDDEADAFDDSLVREAKVGRLHILETQRLIRFMSKPVVVVVPGWAIGSGHSLHVVCDMMPASEEHTKFLQIDPNVVFFDSGFGSAHLVKQAGQKKAREVFSMGKIYSAEEVVDMGMANEAIPHEESEDVALEWVDEATRKSSAAMRMLKYAFNMIDDGMVDQQVFAGEMTRLTYMTEEAQEDRDALPERRGPRSRDHPRYY